MTKFYLLMRRYLTVAMMLGVSVAFAQQTVKGKVTSADDGSGIPGVNILEKGTSNGTVSDGDGNYTISVGANATLSFSFVGYTTQDVVVGSQSTVDVKMASDVTALSEVVVIGYGESKKSDLTGAVASVTSKNFNVGVISSPEQLIQGRTAGVQVTSTSGEPGAGVNIRVRGTSSVRGGNNPLFVVDGVPLAGDDVSAGGADLGRGAGPARNPLNFINPNDIESIDVLKDASATAIYGARGANGVVMITTKSGKGKKRQFEYSSTFNISVQAKKFDLLNRDQFLENLTRIGSVASEQDYGANTNWQDQISRTAFSHRQDISYADNVKNGNYRASFAYEDQKGVIKNSGLERITGRLNANKSFLDDKLKFSLQSTFSRVNDQAAPITNSAGFEGDLLGATYMANPTWPGFADSQISNTVANPLAMLKYTMDRTKTERFLANLSASYEIIPGLTARVSGGMDRSYSIRDNAYSPRLLLSNGVTDNGRASINSIKVANNLFNATLNYSKSFGNSELTALGGYEYQSFNRTGWDARGWGFASPDMNRMITDLSNSYSSITGFLANKSYQQFGFSRSGGLFTQVLFPQPNPNNAETGYNNGIPSVNSVTGGTFETLDEIQSFFGRVNYTLNKKYLFTGTVRMDGSTRFGPDNKYGVFPSGAFAWKLSEESFIPEAFDDLKLRVGYGITGNQEIPNNRFQRRQRFDGLNIQNDGAVNPAGLGFVAFENNGLKWEQTSQLNLGIDFAFFKSKLRGSIDYYKKVTTDLLIQIPSAQPAATPFRWSNLPAEVVNEGVELNLAYDAIENEDFGLGFAFNTSYNRNIVQNLTSGDIDTGQINGQGLSRAFAQRISNGQPLGAFYLREFLGFAERGNVSIYEKTPTEQVFVGKGAIPLYNLGFTINLRYKQFDLSAFMNGQFGHYVYNNTRNAFFTMGSLANGRNITRDGLFIGEGPVNAPDVSTRFLESADFLRMQNLNVGYNLNLDGSSFIKSLRIFGSAQNLFVLTNYSGLDPEVNINRPLGDVPSIGIDYVAYPRARTFTLGINARF